jgi:hypothetical protein
VVDCGSARYRSASSAAAASARSALVVLLGGRDDDGALDRFASLDAQPAILSIRLVSPVNIVRDLI